MFPAGRTAHPLDQSQGEEEEEEEAVEEEEEEEEGDSEVKEGELETFQVHEVNLSSESQGLPGPQCTASSR